MRIVHTLQLPSDVESVPLVRGVLRASMIQLGVLDSCTSDVALAVTEACANVISHARGGGRDYEVQVEINPSECNIRVVDTGVGFDAGALGPAGDLAESGRGVTLMRALVDDLHFVVGADRPGTVVHLTKRLELEEASPLRALAKSS
jgi:serine/threonine-protein kinase RsbW